MTKHKTLRGAVKKVIKPIIPSEPEKAEIEIPEADELYREIRIDNVVTDEKGEKAKLIPGEDVDVTVETDTEPDRKVDKGKKSA